MDEGRYRVPYKEGDGFVELCLSKIEIKPPHDMAGWYYHVQVIDKKRNYIKPDDLCTSLVELYGLDLEKSEPW